MIKLKNAKVTKYGSIQIKNVDLESFAYRQLREYQKHFFEKAHALDIEDFVEFYLNKSIQYYQLSPSDAKIRPLGSTIISDGKVLLLNEGNIELRYFKKGTIIIDENACNNNDRLRFTLAHEAWHAQYDLNLKLETIDNEISILDTKLDIENSFKNSINKTPRDWIEYHADLYAVYLLMPKKFIKELFKKYHFEYFKNSKRIIPSKPKRTWLIISSISNILNVSKTAIAYRLRNLGLISEKVFDSLKIKS